MKIYSLVLDLLLSSCLFECEDARPEGVSVPTLERKN